MRFPSPEKWAIDHTVSDSDNWLLFRYDARVKKKYTPVAQHHDVSVLFRRDPLLKSSTAPYTVFMWSTNVRSREERMVLDISNVPPETMLKALQFCKKELTKRKFTKVELTEIQPSQSNPDSFLSGINNVLQFYKKEKKAKTTKKEKKKD